jgi:DNA invertase Pin-like site-specific DNA recombinase
MKVGYARVSKGEQILDLQLDAFKLAGCGRVFTDHLTGVREDRPGLLEALEFVRPGDVLVVWRLDRLGRTLKYLIELMNQLSARGIGFQSLKEQIDTTTSGGKLVFHIFGALAEFERDLIKERTLAGLEAARARGRKGGHPRAVGLNTPQKVALAKSLYAEQQHTVAQICDTLKVSRATLYRYLSAKDAPEEPRPSQRRPAKGAVEAAHG